MNPETPPENWISYVDPDRDANVDFATLIWFGVIGFFMTLFGIALWFAAKVMLTVVTVPYIPHHGDWGAF